MTGNGVDATERSCLMNNLERSWRLPWNQARRANVILQSWKRVEHEEVESRGERREWWTTEGNNHLRDEGCQWPTLRFSQLILLLSGEQMMLRSHSLSFLTLKFA